MGKAQLESVMEMLLSEYTTREIEEAMHKMSHSMSHEDIRTSKHINSYKGKYVDNKQYKVIYNDGSASKASGAYVNWYMERYSELVSEVEEA